MGTHLSNKCHIARIQTLADGTIRLVIDLQDGKAEDMSTAYFLRGEETFLTILPKAMLEATPEEKNKV